MHDQSHEAAAARLRLALDMYEAGERMIVQRWRRERPQCTAAEIEARLLAWLRERPGEDQGDDDGRFASWARHDP